MKTSGIKHYENIGYQTLWTVSVYIKMSLTMNISCSRLLQRACLFSLIIRKAILSSYWSVMARQTLWLAETVTSAERPFSGFTTSQTWLWLWTRDLKLNPTRMLVISTHNLQSESGIGHLLLVQSLNAQEQLTKVNHSVWPPQISCNDFHFFMWNIFGRFLDSPFFESGTEFLYELFCFISFPINTFHGKTFTPHAVQLSWQSSFFSNSILM